MKRALSMMLMMIVLAGAVFAQNQEFKAGVDYFMPGNDDIWDKGMGLEAQLAFWQREEIGIAIAAGLAKWDFVKISESLYYPYYDISIGVFVEGDAQLIPIGPSALYRPKLQENLSLTLDAGIRYVIVDSSVDGTGIATDYITLITLDDEVDIDNGIIGRLGADLSWKVDARTSLFAGIGYQFDISKGKIKWLEQDIKDNELKAFFVEAGVSFDL